MKIVMLEHNNDLHINNSLNYFIHWFIFGYLILDIIIYTYLIKPYLNVLKRIFILLDSAATISES